ncbi:hypothetical protein ABOM_012230 [Aspergillus bombycis]|uniref:Protein kinase domain-containing protein n=1 Tax=Aspergillus bombycis TaxID=109264 RepID=A0A1F7ZJ91_9EURO|nr:hypothetical protein ABOM_012230 [Aspergillus bombycis]OGM39208.1 hypothetical protein ABOM_012230 [Aspergillus bombycis]
MEEERVSAQECLALCELILEILDQSQPSLSEDSENTLESLEERQVASSKIRIIKEIHRSDASSIFETEFDGDKFAMKLFHNNGDPGFAENGRDLNRFRCELNAYENLRKYHVCKQGVVPYFYGYIDQVDPFAFQPALQHFVNDKFPPKAILLEYLPNTESLNCKNYSDARYQHAIDGMKKIHKAHVHHQDIYPKNILFVPGTPERVVWVDFDVATTFPSVGPTKSGVVNMRMPLLQSLVNSCERIKSRDFLQTQSFISAPVQ